MAVRSIDKGNEAISAIKKELPSADIEPMHLDLTDLRSVREFADTFRSKHSRLDALVNNAGVMALPKREETKDGFEMQMGTNHFGHFLLTELLLDVLKSTASAHGGSRIVNLSSSLHYKGQLKGAGIKDLNWKTRAYSQWGAYHNSKLANVLHAKALARRLVGTGVTAVSLHPGVVQTELMRHLPSFVGTLRDWVLKPMGMWIGVWEGTQTSLWCILADNIPAQPGAFFDKCTAKQPNPEALDEQLQEELYEVSRKAVGLAQGAE